jgi:S-adenosylmethionine decarboxylase
MNEEREFEQFGIHLMVDGYGAPREILKNAELLKQMLHDIPTEMGMHTISEPIVVEVGPKNRKDPGGLSGVVLIAESHFSFHTFPERGFVTLDVYTCQNSLDTDKLINQFKEIFRFTHIESHIQPRGLRYPSDNIYS